MDPSVVHLVNSSLIVPEVEVFFIGKEGEKNLVVLGKLGQKAAAAVAIQFEEYIVEEKDWATAGFLGKISTLAYS